jgi:hypothetical protein
MSEELEIGNTFKVTTVRYIRAGSMAIAENLYLDGLTPDSHQITVECVVCERDFDDERHFNNGACHDCIQAELEEDSAGALACPLGDGGLDCSPFCPSCEGNQFIENTATPLSDTDISVLELCNILHNLAGYTATLVRDECEEWVSAVYDAINLLKVHAGDTDLSGME